MQGKIIYLESKSHYSGAFEKVLDLSAQPKGIYLLQIITDEETATRKIVLN